MSTLASIDINAIVTAIEGVVALVSAAVAAVQTVLKNLAKKSASESQAAAESATAAAVQATADAKNLDDLMNPYVEQTDEQTQLIADGKVSPVTWQMNLDTIEELSRRLIAAGGRASINVVRAVVQQAQGNLDVEYAVMATPTETKDVDEYPAAFISYGTIALVDKWAVVKAVAQEHKCGDWYSIAG